MNLATTPSRCPAGATISTCASRPDFIVFLMARAGLRRGEVCGLRRSDVHLLVDSRRLGCEVARAHLHVVRREDNPNEAWAKSRRQRVVPLDFLVVQAFDVYEFERMRVADAADSDFVFVNLFRGKLGAPMRPDAIGELMAAASRRAGLDVAVRPHQLRHAYGSNVVDAGAGIRGPKAPTVVSIGSYEAQNICARVRVGSINPPVLDFRGSRGINVESRSQRPAHRVANLKSVQQVLRLS